MSMAQLCFVSDLSVPIRSTLPENKVHDFDRLVGIEQRFYSFDFFPSCHHEFLVHW